MGRLGERGRKDETMRDRKKVILRAREREIEGEWGEKLQVSRDYTVKIGGAGKNKREQSKVLQDKGKERWGKHAKSKLLERVLKFVYDTIYNYLTFIRSHN